MSRSFAAVAVLLFAFYAAEAQDRNLSRGTVTRHTWTSKIYPGTVRDYWIYVPAGYDAQKPSPVTIFQDGGAMTAESGPWRVPGMLDSLIRQQEIPAAIGIFVDPGVLPAISAGSQAQANRSFEYDARGDRYARFLIEEIVPEVARHYNLSRNPDDYALAGSGSGGFAALNAAWNCPDGFRRVAALIGGDGDWRGGDALASVVRKTEPRPLRVFLQDTSAHLFAAFDSAGYESRLVNAGASPGVLADALRWIWKDYPKPVAASKVDGRGVYEILDPNRGWEHVGSGYQLTSDSAVDRDGNVFFTDARNNRILRAGSDGAIRVWKQDSHGSHGIAYGPDGRLYAGQHDRKRLVAFSPDGTESVIVEGVQSHHLTVTGSNTVYLAEAPAHKVWKVDSAGRLTVAHEGLSWPRGVHASTDQSLLAVGDAHTRWVWTFQIQPDGSLANGQPFYSLETGDESPDADAGGMTFDTAGFLYVATRLGIQVFDPLGRLSAILDPPFTGGVANLFFAGPELQWLYCTDGDKLYRRRLKRRGAATWNAVKPAAGPRQ